MNLLPNPPSGPASGSSHLVVALTLTESKVVTSTEVNPLADELPVEAALHRRADAMTEILAKIMDRPPAPRFWGLNE